MESTILIAAKKEYTEQLHDILTDNLIHIMREVWISVKKTSHPLRTFQQKLCDTPEWNNQVISRHCESILQKEDISKEYLEKILEAVFLSNIKILSVVKLESKKQTIDIKIPDTQNFTHRCLIQLARELYADPHLIDDRESNSNSKLEIQRNYKRLVKITKESIEKTIRNMIPMKDILDKYLQAHEEESNHSDENIQFEEIPEEFPKEIPEESIGEFPEEYPIQEEYVEPEAMSGREQEENKQEQKNIDDIFMEQPSDIRSEEQPIKVNITEERNFFSDEE